MQYLKDPIAIIRKNGKIVDVNPAFSDLTGFDAKEVKDKHYSEVPPLEGLRASLERSISEGRGYSEQVYVADRVINAEITPISVEDGTGQISIVMKDITQFVRLEHELLKRNKELIITNTLSSAFISSDDMDKVFTELLEKVMIISEFSLGWIGIRKGDAYEIKSTYGISPRFRKTLESQGLESFHRDIMACTEPIYVLEGHAIVKELKGEDIEFFASIPLKLGSDPIGLLALANRTETAFDFELASLLSLIGNNLSLIVEKIRLFQEARQLAITDSLTGLYNARHFYDSMDLEIDRTIRYSTLFSIVLFDLDDFKHLNDTYGHQAGDDVLRSVAHILKASSRKVDTVARYGGEEFILILPNTPKQEAFVLATRIREDVEKVNFLGPEKVRVTLSGGVAVFPDDASDARTLLYAADMSMYQAKAAGKKQIKCYEARDEESL